MPVQLKKFWFQRNKSNELVIETFLGHYTLNVRFDNVNNTENSKLGMKMWVVFQYSVQNCPGVRQSLLYQYTRYELYLDVKL